LAMGDGNFQPPQSYTLPYHSVTKPGALIATDLNGDGKPDLAVVAGGVLVMLNNGDGTLGAPVRVASNTSAYAIVSRDFNGDGIPDLATANADTNNVSILLGNGNGTFRAEVTYAVGTQPQYLAAGDFNRDGHPDLAVTNYNWGGPGSVSILYGVGDGTFYPAVNHPVGNNPQSLAVGDFNGDGRSDLAITYLQGGLAILLNATKFFGAWLKPKEAVRPDSKQICIELF